MLFMNQLAHYTATFPFNKEMGARLTFCQIGEVAEAECIQP